MGAMTAATEGSQWEEEPAVAGGGEASEKIQVSVRLRPLSEREIAAGDPAEWECISDTTIIFRGSFLDRPLAPTAYSFDRVFRSDSSTREVYEAGAKAVALSVVSGINSSIFAYGQTSSGKTYTMTGITEYTVADIYEYISKHVERAFVLKFSAMEIYNEVVKDLLGKNDAPLKLWDDPDKGTYVENLTEEILRDCDHLKELLSICEAQRKTGETYLNENSSRSHQILKLTIESSSQEFLGKDNSTTLIASVNFVDLAGSERASQALSAGARLKEGCHINKSLLTLGSVIRKLSNGRNSHVPYRDSKLTRILQPSLGGNARTAIICTMSPARSHIDQSRNTLLFASCAKEVATNARVNVVMSDKALVKHLQRELARLENVVRYTPSSSNLEALLKEKDSKISKMEEEIRELKLQRDLAQSRLDDLLQVVRNGLPVKQVVTSQQSEIELSEVTQHSESHNEKNHHSFSPRNSVNSRALISSNNREDTTQNSHQDSEDLCKEVQCIEMDSSTERVDGSEPVSATGSNSLSATGSHLQGSSDLNRSINSRPRFPTPVTLEQHLQNVRRTFIDIVKPNPEGSRGLTLGKSRSCRYSEKSIYTLFPESEHETPPGRSLLGFPELQEHQRRGSLLAHNPEADMLSRAGSVISDSSTARNAFNACNASVASEADLPGIGEFVAELKEMAQTQYRKQLLQNAEGEFGTSSIGLDPIPDVMESPSSWPLIFEKKQEEIIELWHQCNVSLVHRTYFFLLFKGDPGDSIYMEVELRRLSFLKSTYDPGNTDGKGANSGGNNSQLISSMKRLQREREMLCRQMQKRLTLEERESIYTKWGIPLDSKRRRLQVTRHIWTETNDLEHVRESAALVGKLIGLLEPGKVLREMFGLSFAPQQSASRRSYNSWRYGISSTN